MRNQHCRCAAVPALSRRSNPCLVHAGLLFVILGAVVMLMQAFRRLSHSFFHPSVEVGEQFGSPAFSCRLLIYAKVNFGMLNNQNQTAILIAP
jgi:hypothetical protein